MNISLTARLIFVMAFSVYALSNLIYLKIYIFLSELGESMPRREISWRDVVLIEFNGEMSA